MYARLSPRVQLSTRCTGQLVLGPRSRRDDLGTEVAQRRTTTTRAFSLAHGLAADGSPRTSRGGAPESWERGAQIAGSAVRPKPLLRFLLAGASAGRDVPIDGSRATRLHEPLSQNVRPERRRSSVPERRPWGAYAIASSSRRSRQSAPTASLWELASRAMVLRQSAVRMSREAAGSSAQGSAAWYERIMSLPCLKRGCA
jgi:hypothetical protein